MEIYVDPRDGPLMPKFRRIRRKQENSTIEELTGEHAVGSASTSNVSTTTQILGPESIGRIKRKREYNAEPGRNPSRGKLSLEARYNIVTEIDEIIERGEDPNFTVIGKLFFII